MDILPRKSKIGIIGAGAMGSVIGGMLVRQGHKVLLVGRRPHIEGIRKRGLHISEIWGDYRIRDLNVVTFERLGNMPILRSRCVTWTWI